MYWNKEEVFKNKSKIKKVFFYRICGTGMGAAASLLKEAGLEVEGADSNFYPPMSDYLQNMEIPLFNLEEASKEKLEEYDLVVVGNVVPRNSDQAKLIESLSIPYCSFPAAMGALVLNDVNVIGISGTHGKTTTTYLCTQIFEKLGVKPGYFIGGVIDGRPSSTLGDGSFFFIESDEYDCAYFEKYSKFIQYEIDQLVMTSLEYDHADIYDSIEDIKNEFRKVLPDLKKSVVANFEYYAIQSLAKESDHIDWHNFAPEIINEGPEGTEFKLVIEDQEYQFQTNLVGFHNILNISVPILLAYLNGFPVDDIQKVVQDLKMVKRRQELRGHYKGCPVIDDFAHHPRSVALTIDSIKKRYPKYKINAFFEPNSATARSDLFRAQFSKSLKNADHTIILKNERPTSVKDADDFDVTKACKEIGDDHCTIVANLDELNRILEVRSQEEAVHLFLSNGTCFNLWSSDFIDNL